MEPIREGSYVPDVVIFLNPSENLSAIRECTLKNIPTVGIVDTDSDPRLVTYPIPANMEVSNNPLAVLSVLTKTERPNGRFDHQHTQYRRTGGQDAADAVCHEGEDWQKGLSLGTTTEATTRRTRGQADGLPDKPGRKVSTTACIPLTII
ncbi:30S ribosomal protein S2 [archaeon]|nr:MAG: 30S ribosomal protein S2 [archaeon]